MHPDLRTSLTGLLALGLAVLAPAVHADGVPVSTAPDRQWSPRIVTDPAGGAWVAWLDRRSGYSTDVYGCRLDANGAPSTGGAAQGDTLTWITCLKEDLVLTADGTGGALAAWSDHRCLTPEAYDIYVLRLGADGLPLANWPLNGAAVTAAPGWQVRPALAIDGSGGAFIAWVDLEVAPVRIRAQHLRADGTLDPAWPSGGVVLASTSPDSAAPSVGPDGAGGFYVAWEDHRDGDVDLRLQRVTAAGTITPGWPVGGVGACTWPNEQSRPLLVAGVSGVALVWLDGRGPAAQLYACRFLPNGARAPGWPAGGLAVAPSLTEQHSPAVLRADVGGLRLAWSEDRGGASGADVFAQRLDSTGVSVAGWPAGGAVVCAAPGAQFDPALAPDAAGGAFFAWTDDRDTATTGSDLYVLRLDAGGSRVAGWPQDGYALCAAPGNQVEVRLTGNGRGGAFAVWTDGRNLASSGEDITTRAVGPSGLVSPRASGLAATHHDGQTFLEWSAPPGRGWRYRIYAAQSPIATPADLAAATLLGSVGDSSACDLRLTHLLGAPYGYRIEPGGAELQPGSGLFVRTILQAAASFYAVTSAPGSFAEDVTIVPGDNALVAAVAETVATPRPVFQRSVARDGPLVEIWTLWTWNADAPGFPAMAGVPGLPFDCGLTRGQGSQAPLVVGFHARHGSLFDAAGGMFLPGEWVLALDDMLPNGENTFWFGYHRDYDVMAANNPPPLSGEVVGFTARRVDWTLDWVRREFPIDTTRVFTYGYSMGAMGATQLAFRTPHKLAGLMSVIGQFDFSFLADPVPACWFNPGGPFRSFADQIWGAVGTNLGTSGGPPVFELLNGTRIVERDGGPDLPPMMVFNGRKDVNVGWAEKVRFWGAMQAHHRGGYFFWDNRVHGVSGAVWIPMQLPWYLDRFRTDRSYPALSNCDLDGDPGDGSPASGDSVGTLNGHVEWSVPQDDEHEWSVTLTMRPLVLATGTIPAPESALVDVTPRRLQELEVAPLATVPYRVVRVADEAVLARGFAAADSFGVVTIQGVRVHRLGTRLELGTPALAGVPPAGATAGLRLACATPSRGGSLEASVDWPSGEESRLDLLDVGGRRVLTLFDGRPAAGRARYAAPASAVAPGLYFLSARCGAERLVRRVVLLR